MRVVAQAFPALLACLLMAWPAHGQAPYPSQGIRLIVPYAAGGVPDTVARFVGQRLQERIGQSIVVENRPGGNGSVAAATLAAAPADGYTLLVTDSAMLSVNPLFFKQLGYSPHNDFVPVALLARAPLFLAVNSDVPVATLREFIEYVEARPGEINYGSSGVGSTHHLTMEAMKAALHLNMTHIPYRGTGQSVPALLGGHVQVLFSAYPSLKGAVESGRVRLLATNELAARARRTVLG
jgi:tripartite-type tricarboxylate transporter receptor subunit TctC